MAGLAALFVWLAFVNIWIFVFVVGVVISIFLHELGHFATAKWTGMKATQFFLFFGPRLWSFRRGETEYGVRAIPLGAFVRIVGMNRMDEVEPADEARSYRQATFPRRLLVISAGSIMHILIAIVLLFGVYATAGRDHRAGRTTGDRRRRGPGAARVGRRHPRRRRDRVGRRYRRHHRRSSSARPCARSSPSDVVDLVVIRDGETLTIPVGLGANTSVPEDDPLFGVRCSASARTARRSYEDHGIVGSAVNAVTDIFPVTWESTKGIVKVLNPVNLVDQLTDTENADPTARPTTIYGIATVSDDVGDSGGLAGVLYLLAILNIFVGVFNMMPLLPLDGGHAAIAVYERIQEQRRHMAGRYFADVERLMPFAMGVIVVLAMLMFTGLYLDITDPIG